jgi:hypothetical protein
MSWISAQTCNSGTFAKAAFVRTDAIGGGASFFLEKTDESCNARLVWKCFAAHDCEILINIYSAVLSENREQ